MLKEIMLFLHVLGAIGMGIYVLMPMLAGHFRKLSGAAQEGMAASLIVGGRVGQFALIVQLLTGGYLMSQAKYTVAWIVVILVLFLVIGALTGIVQKPIQTIAEASRESRDASDAIARVRTLSILILILYLIIVWLMMDPWYASAS